MKKKILLFGPLGDFGGREIEANIIAKSLIDDYELSFFSTKYYTPDSYAFLGVNNISHSSFQRKVYQAFGIVKLLANLVRLKNKKERLAYAYTQNSVSRNYFDFKKIKAKILFAEIEKVDAVMACVQITSGYLKEAVEIAHQLNKPFFIRTTGTIHDFDIDSFQFLNKVTCFIYHSETNANNLNKQWSLPYVIIDQCAQLEQKLLALPIEKNQDVYGYLGRLSAEKGILELIRFFQNLKDTKLFIAGDGPLKKEVESLIQSSENIEYLTQCLPKDLDVFFKKINTLIIPSPEESGPLVGLEAMAAGKVILSTKVGAMEERLAATDNDFWFDTNDQQSFFNSLAKIKNLNTEAFESIAVGNRARYLAEYQFAVIKNKYLDCLNKYLN